MNTRAIIQHISGWLHEYSENAGSKGFVIGISGGIDSAVTSTLCANTGLPTLCLEMPIHQHQSQVARASKHIAWLKNTYRNAESAEVNLTPVYDTFVQMLPPHDNHAAHEFSLVNTRARFRMTTLYYFAALRGFLVAGTGNKVEDFGVGFYTKYGDGGVDLSPIADLMKSEVYMLGGELGIINDIMTAPPTDGLWGDSRTDEEQIGATYPELEWAMMHTGSEDNLSPRQKEVLGIYRNFNRKNQHKMRPIPVCEIPKLLRLG